MRRRRAASLAAAGLFALATFGPGAPTVEAATDQFQDSAVSTYVLDPDHTVVHVTTAFTFTNKAPSTTSRRTCSEIRVDPYYGTYVITGTCVTRRDYYYNSYEFWIERDATAMKAKADTGSVSIKPGKREGNFRLVKLGYAKLYYGKTRKLEFTYDLPAGGPRSPAQRRVGNVWSTFCAYGPGTDSGILNIVVPSGFEMKLTRSMASTSASGKTTYGSGKLKQPWKFSSCLSGLNEDGYVVSELTAGGRRVTIEAWKEDTAWADAVRVSVTEDLPALARAVGAESSGELTIREDVARLVGSGTSAFDHKTSTLRISEMLATRQEVTHTLPGLWFGSQLFREKWMTEGYSSWAEHLAGVSDAPCGEPGPFPGSSGISLAVWSRLVAEPTADDLAIDAYKRQAACHIVSAIAEAIGPERMLVTVDALRAGVDPYVSTDVDAPSVAQPMEWRRWLDIVEQRGLVPAGADPDLASTLIRRYGVTKDNKFLAEHATARSAYAALLALTGKPAPSVVTTAMTNWRFDQAETAMKAATTAWTTARSIEEVLPAVEVDGAAVQQAIADAESQDALDAAVTLATRQAALAADMAGALAVAHAPRDLVQEVGLIGTTLPDEAVAVDAVVRIDGDATSAISGQLRSLIGAAREVGVQRLAIGVGVVVAFLLAILALFIFRRRRRRRRAMTAAANLDMTVESNGAPGPDNQDR